MKKNKDFNYYGKKRVKVQRVLKAFKEDKTSYELYVFIPLVLLGLIFDIKSNFSFEFSTTGGILATILFTYLSWIILSFLFVIILSFLDKYYFKKRKELLDKYIAAKGYKNYVLGGKDDL